MPPETVQWMGSSGELPPEGSTANSRLRSQYHFHRSLIQFVATAVYLLLATGRLKLLVLI
jgi:hypothetical protein